MPATYDSIASTTVTGSAVTNIDFTNIPQTYTDLVFILALKSTTGTLYPLTRFGNSSYDTGSNYSYTVLTGNGTAASSTRASSQTSLQLGYNSFAGTDNNHLAIVHFMNYSNTTTNKTILIRSNRASDGTDAEVGLWRSTAAINQVRFTLDFSNVRIDVGSNITLYGIKAA